MLAFVAVTYKHYDLGCGERLRREARRVADGTGGPEQPDGV